MKPTTAATALAFLVALLLPGPAHAGSWTWPVGGEVITAYRNGDDPYARGQHRGIDIAAPVGERVVAATAGRVTFAGVAGSSGLTVSVRTADGRFGVSYLHLSDAAVREGDAVQAGGALGAVGTSGRRSAERPHLHFGVREAGERHAYLDPLDFLGSPPPPRGEPRAPAPAPAPSEVPAEPRGDPAPAEPRGAPASAPAPASIRHGSPVPHTAPEPSPGRMPYRSARRLPGADLFARPIETGPAAPAPVAAPASARGDLPARANGSAIAGPDGAAGGERAATTSSPPLGTAPAAVGRPAQNPATSAAHAGATEPLARQPAARSGRGSIDVAWLAACVGLLLAATALGRSATAPRSKAGRDLTPRPSHVRGGRLSARAAGR